MKTEQTQTLLRFSTAGSVDDGKSTLVGRLLHDSKNILDDQMSALKKASLKHEKSGSLALALVTDGLRAEREQGITIDVAYRYFATAKRRFILADTPGHEQYTRNMATGASTADLAIILVDAKNGLMTQTKRHSFISSLLGVPRLLIAVNKMDLVGWSQDRYEEIRAEFLEFAAKLNTKDIRFTPISALTGDNVVEQSKNMPWYHGETVLEYLENVYIGGDSNRVDFRLPVQLVIRGDSTFRGYAGQIASGEVRVGEEVIVLPSMRKSKVHSIEQWPDKKLSSAHRPMSVSITLEDEIDISRGDMIVRAGNIPHTQTQFEAMLVWMDEQPMNPDKQYLVMHTTRTSKAHIDGVRYRIDINTLSRLPGQPLSLNEIGRVSFATAKPLFFDTYQRNRNTGNFIVIDPETNRTVAGGMFIDALPEEHLVPTHSPFEEEKKHTPAHPLHEEKSGITRSERETRAGHRAVTVWCTGLSGAGKSTIAREVERNLFSKGASVFHLDGDNLRMGLNRGLGFSNEERSENIRRAAEVAKLLNNAGVTVICSFISPFERDRTMAREIIGKDAFIEVYLATPLSVCEERDPHGMYKKARAGEIREFTGVNAPYEAPQNPDITVRTDTLSLDACSELLVAAIEKLWLIRS